MNLEKAIFVEGMQQLQEQDLSPYSRIYFGHETCDRRIPSLNEFSRAKEFCSKQKLSFSLVSPICTNQGIKMLLPLLEQLSGEDELIVNDFGVLQLASKQTKAKVVAGRILNRQYRDPRIAFLKNPPQEMLHHLRLSHASSQLFLSLLKKSHVQRVELDNLLQGIETDLSSTGFHASLYHPFVFVSATRLCLTANCDKLSHAKKVGIFPCGKECVNYSFILENKELKRPLYLFGNALYFENKKLPSALNKKGIDRLVFTLKNLP